MKDKYTNIIEEYKLVDEELMKKSKEKESEMLEKNKSLLSEMQEVEKQRMSNQLKFTIVTSLDESIVKICQNIEIYFEKMGDIVSRLKDTTETFETLKKEFTKGGSKLLKLTNERNEAKAKSDFFDTHLISLLDEVPFSLK